MNIYKNTTRGTSNNVIRVFFIFLLSISFINCAEFSEVLGVKNETSASKGEKKSGRYYIVKKGDTLDKIGNKFGVTQDYLMDVNEIDDPSSLKVGQKIYIPSKNEVRKSFVAVAETKVEEETEVESEVGVNEEEVSTVEVMPQEAPRVQEESEFIWPVNARVTSGFGDRKGRQHDGVDIPAPRGTPVVASKAGYILFAGKLAGYGNLAIIKHQNNYFTAYGHLNVIHVKKGKRIKQGDLVGTVGSTGRARSTHLHFEIRHKTESKDPLLYLPKNSLNVGTN